MLQKFLSDKTNITKQSVICFLSQAPTHHSFTFYPSWSITKTVCRIFHFRFSLIFVKAFVHLWLLNVIIPFTLSFGPTPLIFKLQHEVLWNSMKTVWVEAPQKLGEERFKDTHLEKAPPNKTSALTKSMNMDIWVVGTSNQLFIRRS